MEIDITTPSLLFPAISLLLLAYTNRFLGLSAVVRQLHHSHLASPKPVYLLEIENLRRRLRLIRDMQSWGVAGLLLCTLCMLLVFRGFYSAAQAAFAGSIIFMALSLILSFIEIRMSTKALDLHLLDLEKGEAMIQSAPPSGI